MLNDSQQIGHSKPSSWLRLEEFSSSEHPGHAQLGSAELLFSPMLEITLEVNFHIASGRRTGGESEVIRDIKADRAPWS